MESEFDMLDIEQQVFLLALVRKSLQQHYAGDKLPVMEDIPPILQRKGACFVTYKIGEKLRGCIGSIYPELPLYREVIRRAVDAAVHDPRFPPLKQEEIEKIGVEISVLSPMREISSPEEFQPGEHGILLKYKEHRAVYLPQVAPEQGWDRKDTLRHLCNKAGIPDNSWKEKKASLYVFTAQVFGE